MNQIDIDANVLSESDPWVELEFSELEISDDATGAPGYEMVHIEVGDETAELLLNPNHFPITVGDTMIGLSMEYTEDSTTMTVGEVERRQPPGPLSTVEYDTLYEESMDVHEMTDYQEIVTFLYLIGRVVNGDSS